MSRDETINSGYFCLPPPSKEQGGQYVSQRPPRGPGTPNIGIHTREAIIVASSRSQEAWACTRVNTSSQSLNRNRPPKPVDLVDTLPIVPSGLASYPVPRLPSGDRSAPCLGLRRRPSGACASRPPPPPPHLPTPPPPPPFTRGKGDGARWGWRSLQSSILPAARQSARRGTASRSSRSVSSLTSRQHRSRMLRLRVGYSASQARPDAFRRR